MAQLYGWDGAGIGLALEPTYGTPAGSAALWLPIENEDILVDDPAKPKRSIVSTPAPNNGFRAQSARYQGIAKVGGTFVVEGMFEGLDMLFHSFFGDVTQAVAGSGFLHTYPNTTTGLLDLPATNPGLTLFVDKDKYDLTCAGGFVESIEITWVPEELPRFAFEVYAQSYVKGSSGFTPTFVADKPIEDWMQCVQLSIDEAAYSTVEADGFQIKLTKNLLRVPAHDCTTNGIRKPKRGDDYATAIGSAVRLFDDSSDTWQEYLDMDNIGVRMKAEGADYGGSNTYLLQLTMDAAMQQSPSGPKTEAPGARVETISFEADTNGTTPAVQLQTRNLIDASSW